MKDNEFNKALVCCINTLTIRERLIDLFKKIEYTAFPELTMKANLANQFTDYALNSIVDEMIKNGVIAPPCNVGDTVYPKSADRRFRAFVEKIEITTDGLCFWWVQYDVGVDCTECWDEGCFSIAEIGKTVFLTEAEYEIALKGGADNG